MNAMMRKLFAIGTVLTVITMFFTSSKSYAQEDPTPTATSVPQKCNGACWDVDLAAGSMTWTGPIDGSEDITEDSKNFDGKDYSPLNLMIDGKVKVVNFEVKVDARMEVCPIGSLDGEKLEDLIKKAHGKSECYNALPVKVGKHVLENNTGKNSGFGVRFLRTGWSADEARITELELCWKVDGKTATWVCAGDVEILMPPSVVAMVQTFQVVDLIKFTTTVNGQVNMCNGELTGAAKSVKTDGSCKWTDIPPGTYTYHAPAAKNRTASGVSWSPTTAAEATPAATAAR